MIWQNTKLLFALYFSPLKAMSGLMDNGNWIFGAIAAAIVAMVFQFTVSSRIYTGYQAVEAQPAYHQPLRRPSTGLNRNHALPESVDEDEEEYYGPVYVRRPLPLVGDFGWHFLSFQPASFLSTVFGLMLLYVPATILVVVLIEPIGSFGIIFRRDYGSLLNCTLAAWTASHLPFAICGLIPSVASFGPGMAFGLWAASALLFGIYMILAVRVVFGTSYAKSIFTVCVSWTALSIQQRLFSLLSPFLFSPFLLIYAYLYLRGGAGDLASSFRRRQNFRRYLEASTINPRDAEAHYQLGLVHLQRRQYGEAIERFKKAVEIDATETDAWFQLGRIAREQNRLQDAIEYFSRVIELDEKHSLSEVWREIGATYVAAEMYPEAAEPLQRYVERRPYDPEGLFYYGKTLNQLGRHAEAQEMFRNCIEAVKTMPSYRRSQMSKWKNLAESQLSSAGAKI